MGFNLVSTEFLIQAVNAGVDYRKTITIGRQRLHGSRILFEKLFRRYQLPISELTHLIENEDRYCESFLRMLGAATVDSLDASGYENATVICDMNDAIPNLMKGRYSTVIDGGSLEHIFNFPVAVKNCMELLEPGGHFIGISPCNNFLWHGFYQFSPELFYGVFSRSNGFSVVKMLLFFNDLSLPVYEVVDPLTIRGRVTLRNSKESYLFVLAKRENIVSVLSLFPQQSDYAEITWKNYSVKQLRGYKVFFAV